MLNKKKLLVSVLAITMVMSSIGTGFITKSYAYKKFNRQKYTKNFVRRTKAINNKAYKGDQGEELHFRYGLWYKLDAEGKATVTKFTGSATRLSIPTQINGHDVTKIADDAFNFEIHKKKKLTYLGIPYGITHIGKRAFYGNSLPYITIPYTVEKIGDGAFAKNKLRDVLIMNPKVEYKYDGNADENSFGNFKKRRIRVRQGKKKIIPNTIIVKPDPETLAKYKKFTGVGPSWSHIAFRKPGKLIKYYELGGDFMRQNLHKIEFNHVKSIDFGRGVHPSKISIYDGMDAGDGYVYRLVPSYHFEFFSRVVRITEPERTNLVLTITIKKVKESFDPHDDDEFM